MTSGARTAEAVIVGGGINGASIAFFLTELGMKRVCLLERRYPASGATGRSVALLRVHYANRPEASLAWESLKIYRHWEDLVGGTCGYKRTGFLWLVSASEREKLDRNVHMLRSLGAPVEHIDAATVHELQPHLQVDDVGGAGYEPEGGYADPSDATNSLLRRARERGVEVLTSVRVQRILVRGGRVAGVATDAGEIASPCVVIAAGASSAALARTAGVELPVDPRRITTGSVHLPPAIRAPMTFIDAIIGTYLKPDVGDVAVLQVNTGAAHTVDPEVEPEGVPPSALVAGAAHAARRVPALEAATMARAWAGVDGFTPDGRAIIGKVPELPGLFVSVGGSGKGFKVAPAAGRALAEQITGNPPSAVDPAPFRLSRFAEAATTWSDTEYAGTRLA